MKVVHVEHSLQIERLSEALDERDAQLERSQDRLLSTLQRCTAAEAELALLRKEKEADKQTIKRLSEAWWGSADDYRFDVLL